MENTNGIILLVYGIPAAGKTRLVTGLCEESHMQGVGTFVCVHFDDFYPPDLRGCIEELIKQQKSDPCSDQPLFKLKHARQDVNNNLNHFIAANKLGTAGDSSVSNKSCDSWRKFLNHVSSSNPHVSLDGHGRIHGAKHPIVLLLDDNMVYHSIRHEYYQIARKYQLGFGEVLVQCSLQLAISRNDKRPTPVPLQTIKNMADELEPAQPDKFSWEQNSVTIDSQMIDNAWPVVWPLIQTACTNPVQPVVDEDSEQGQLDRQHTQESIVHQADQVLRKCVTNKLSALKGSPELPAVAKSANAIKRELLELIRSRQLLLPTSSCQLLAVDVNFVTSIEQHFSEMYDKYFVNT